MRSALPSVVLDRRATERVRSRHPWVYRSALTGRLPDGAGGELVAVHDRSRRLLGHGLYSDRSQIAVRMVTFGREPVDPSIWSDRLDQALAFREAVAPGVDALRLVHSEGDGLPGLIVDRYADVLVLQLGTQAMDRLAGTWCDLLEERLAPRSIVSRGDLRARELEGLERTSGVLRGEDPGEVEIRHGEVRLRVAPLAGQKTGTFLDQRENRVAAARWATGDAADVFCGDGAFGVQLARSGRVTSVVGVDSSPVALEAARANAELNHVDLDLVEANAFDWLRACDRDQRGFDTIVLDPPAFAHNKASIPGATRGYKEINLRAMRLLRPGGVLVTCSCSYHMTESRFLGVLAAAAADVGRPVSVLERRGQAVDHRVSLTVPESAHLTCVVLRVA